jgi:hypothetical protein
MITSLDFEIPPPYSIYTDAEDNTSLDGVSTGFINLDLSPTFESENVSHML